MEEHNMNNEIKFPQQKTYFIAYTDTDIFGYGWVDPDQEMTTGQPILWTTLSEEEWVYKLETEFDTNPFPPDPDDEIDVNNYVGS
jgi:hypothetical protein